MELQVGIVVSLKSGGPSMTVSETKLDSEEVKCVWFDHGGIIHEYQFNKNALVEVDEILGDAENTSFEVTPNDEIPF